MINMLPLGPLIVGVSVAYTAMTLILYLILQNETDTLIEQIIFSAKGAAGLNLLLFLFFTFGWRKLWEKLPILNKLIFPDLNGTWDMTINWEWDGNSGEANATAIIKQNFLSISMEVESDQSDSESLLAKAKKDPESGRPILYYIYRNTPKDAKKPPYLGTAVLKLGLINPEALEGNYYTDRNSFGRYHLNKM